MCPPGDTARAAALDGKQSRIQLRNKPENQVNERRDLNESEKEEDGHKAGNARARIEDKIRAQHASHRAARPDHRHIAGWKDIGLQESRGGAAEQVEDEVFQATHARFHVVAKDEQHPHVVDNVEPAAVQEHG